MKRFLSILLVSAILMQVFNGAIIYAGFVINQDFISKTFCVNRSKPMMHCNGQCHLKKQLDKQEKNEQNAPQGDIKDKTELVYFYKASQPGEFPVAGNNNNYFSVGESETSDFTNFVFRPPSC